MRAAVDAAQPDLRVILVDKGEPGRSGTSPPGLHGLVTTLHPTDSEGALFRDIVRTGGDLNDYDLVRKAVHEAGIEPERLEKMGVHSIAPKTAAMTSIVGTGIPCHMA